MTGSVDGLIRKRNRTTSQIVEVGHMRDVVVVEAVRSPVGRRKGGLSAMHAADLLGDVQRAVVERSGIDPAEIGQVVGGLRRPGRACRPPTSPARRGCRPGSPSKRRARRSTPSAARRSRPPTWPPRSIAAGVVDVAVACGVEVMSVVSMGSSVPKDPFVGKPINRKYWEHYENTSQFEGAERIAEKFGVTRDQLDALRQAVAGPRRGRMGRGSLRHPGRADRGADARRATASPTARTPSPATKACATPRSRRSPTSSRCSTATPRSTPPARRRRSATVPARCC